MDPTFGFLRYKGFYHHLFDLTVDLIGFFNYYNNVFNYYYVDYYFLSPTLSLFVVKEGYKSQTQINNCEIATLGIYRARVIRVAKLWVGGGIS